MQQFTKADIAATIQTVKAIADVIKELSRVPNGELYVRVMQYMSLGTYTKILETLKRAELIDEKNSVLIWIGPKN